MKRMKMLYLLMILAVFSITAIADNPPDEKEKKWTITVEGNIFSHMLQEPKKEASNLDFFNEKYLESNLKKVRRDDVTQYFNGSGLIEKSILSSNFKDKNSAWSDFITKLQEEFKDEPLMSKLGAITTFNKVVYNHYDENERGSTEDVDLNRVILQIKNFLGDLDTKPEQYGVCRQFSFAATKMIEDGFNMPSYVITAYMHTLNQILIPGGKIVLLDRRNLIADLDGLSIRNKDDVDIAVLKMNKMPHMQDLIIDVGKNNVIYNNRYNNFSGFWSKLQNRDNSDRARNFFFNENLSLFSYLNEKSVYRLSLQKARFGIQLYGVNKNNEYNRFLDYNYGTNIAFIPWKSKSLNGRLYHRMFLNFGAYYSKYKVFSKHSLPFHYSANVQINIEDYFKYLFRNNLSIGMISNLIQFNQEIELPEFNLDEDFDGSFYFSPFIGWEKENYINNDSKKFILAGLQSTMPFYLPKTTKITTIPWILVGSKSTSKIGSFSYQAKLELQKASSRLNLFSSYETKKRYMQIRAFYEDYSHELETRSLFIDAYGFDLRFGQKFKKDRKLIISSAYKFNNSGKQSLNFSLGLTF
jgi:hypothetical protein